MILLTTDGTRLSDMGTHARRNAADGFIRLAMHQQRSTCAPGPFQRIRCYLTMLHALQPLLSLLVVSSLAGAPSMRRGQSRIQEETHLSGVDHQGGIYISQRCQSMPAKDV